jgi:hypothetical protein
LNPVGGTIKLILRGNLMVLGYQVGATRQFPQVFHVEHMHEASLISSWNIRLAVVNSALVMAFSVPLVGLNESYDWN